MHDHFNQSKEGNSITSYFPQTYYLNCNLFSIKFKPPLSSLFFLMFKKTETEKREQCSGMMIKEFLQQKGGKEEDEKERERLKLWRVAENIPELSLGTPSTKSTGNNLPLSEILESNLSRKRKSCWDHFNCETKTQSSIELQLKDPLPVDWEQCLDLQSGRMYYLNRKTLKRSWCWPKDQKQEFELNLSPLSTSEGRSSNTTVEDNTNDTNSSSNMVAVACFKCHLLVMLCKSSPSCPNCKYLHSISPPQNLLPTAKPLETLSLLN